jgi:PKD repeat protein
MPTYTITNGGDDGAVWATSPTAWSINATQTSVLLGRTSGNWPSNGWFRFTGITIPRYSTITEAYLRLYNNTSPLVGTPAITVRADDSPAPAAPTSAQDFLNKVRTAAGAAGPSSTAPGYQDIPINQVIQELVNKYDYIGGVIQILVDDAGTAASNIFSVRTLEAGSAYTAQLVIEFTSGVPEAPVAAFSADKTSGNVPLTVQFTDESTGQIDTRSWEFGDGQSSTEQNPAHTFSDVGTFTVTLTVTGPGGQDFFQMYINALPVSVPNSVFSASPISGPIPLTVQFIDESTGSVTSWAWDFGDGGTSTLQNPAHTFLTEGTFTVTLTVTGPGGSSPSILEIDALPAAALIISPLEIYPGYDTVGVRSAFSGDALHTAIMEYKESSGAIWRQGLEMYCDRRPIIREMLSAAGWTDEVNRWQNQNRSVVFFLVSNSAYDVRVSYYAGELIEEFIALTTGEVVGSIWTYDGHSFASYLEAVTYIKTYGVLIGEVQGSAVTLNDDPLVTGTSYFVDSTMGNDTTGDGSAALPWATIPRALQAVHPGDEIRLRGTFNPLSIPISGNYENYIHLVSDDPDSPALITGTSSGSIPAVVSCTGGYIKFGNVDLINTGTSGSQPCLSISGRGVIVDGGYIRPGTNAEYNTAGVSVRPESNDILIQHATIETLVGQGTN